MTKKVTKEVKFHYIPINSQIREEIVYKVQLTDLRLQDTYFKFSALTEDDRRIFSSKHTLNRPYEFPDNVQMQVTYEFDLNLYRVDREVYSFLDWIGDIGGLMEGLILFFGLVLAAVQFNKFDHFMIE